MTLLRLVVVVVLVGMVGHGGDRLPAAVYCQENGSVRHDVISDFLTMNKGGWWQRRRRRSLGPQRIVVETDPQQTTVGVESRTADDPLPSLEQLLLNEQPSLSIFAALLREVGAVPYVEQSRDLTTLFPTNQAFRELLLNPLRGPEDEDGDVHPYSSSLLNSGRGGAHYYYDQHENNNDDSQGDNNDSQVLNQLIKRLPWNIKWRIIQYHFIPNQRVYMVDPSSISRQSPPPRAEGGPMKKYATWEGSPIIIGVPPQQLSSSSLRSGFYTVNQKPNVLNPNPLYYRNGLAYIIHQVMIPPNIDLTNHIDNPDQQGRVVDRQGRVVDEDDFLLSNATKQDYNTYYNTYDALNNRFTGGPIHAIFIALNRQHKHLPAMSHNPSLVNKNESSSFSPPSFVLEANEKYDQWNGAPDQRRQRLGLATLDNPSAPDLTFDTTTTDSNSMILVRDPLLLTDLNNADISIANQFDSRYHAKAHDGVPTTVDGVTDDWNGVTDVLLHGGDQRPPTPTTTTSISDGGITMTMDSSTPNWEGDNTNIHTSMQQPYYATTNQDLLPTQGTGAIHALGVGQAFDIDPADILPSPLYPSQFGWAPTAVGWGDAII